MLWERMLKIAPNNKNMFTFILFWMAKKAEDNPNKNHF